MSDQVNEKKQASRSARRVGRFLRRSWQGLLVGVLAIALGVLAYLSPGLVQADVRLDEGTVYAGKRDGGLIGTLNAQIDELAAATSVGDTQFRVLQDERLVLAHGTQSSTLVQYNPGRNRMESPVQLPTGASVELVAGKLLVVNADNGRVWFGEADKVLNYDFQNEKALFEVGEFGAATATVTGDVIGVNAQKSVLVRPGAEGATIETPLPFTLDPLVVNVDISAVGDKAVVLDRQSGQIWVEGMSKAFEVSGASSARLAAPAADALGGEEGAKAIYATQAGLIAVTNDGPRSLSGNIGAAPIEPVQLGGCVYSAFGNQFVRKCRGVEAEVREIPQLPENADLAFQVNRTTIVLNDLVTGYLWMVNKDMLLITDWEPVAPQETDDQQEENQTETVIPPDRDQPNRAPIAKDDVLGARAGRSTLLTVLDNDSDPDGDVLTITAPENVQGATLQTVRGGAGLQITVDSEATGDISFTYRISDGRPGGEASANVTVRVTSPDPKLENGAPFKHPLAQPLTIGLGDTITKRVLLDWRDPDGDSLILEDAWLPPDSGAELSFTPDGQITLIDFGKTAGTKKVNLKISDGYSVTDGELLVNVVDDVVDPIAYGDFETVAVGKTVTVHPLANDVGSDLQLSEVDGGECGCAISTNYREKWFTFSAEKAGIYYVTYKVTNGPSALGLVRIDVRAQSQDRPPVAALDVALLPPGGSVMIDPLLNDSDADGDVLVVQSVSQHPGLKLVLERRHLLTITANSAPTTPVTLTYWVSDGKYPVQGTIVVIPTPTTGTVQPQAQPDEIRVRAGSTQAADVLANDVSPIGLELTVDQLVENPLKDRAWIDGDTIRVSVPAGAQAAQSNITYQAKDSDGAIASSTLRVTVVSEDVGNSAPAPRQVVERVLAGTTTRLAIPLSGIDPDGDAVRLVGIGSGPQLGRVMATGDGWMTYEAFQESKGTDVFSYQVIDSHGAVATGEIRVGVAPAGKDNNPPTGMPDEIAVRPGSHVQIPLKRNDLDVDGDAISYAASDPVELEGVDLIEIIDNTEASFIAPEEEGVYAGKYYIEDARGLSGSGDLTVTVDKSAPLLPPEARDDLVSVSAVVGKDWVEVDPLSNDFDPDGARESLRVSIPATGLPEDVAPRATDDGLKVTAPVTDRMQQIRYVVTDADGQTDVGLIILPGRNDSVPVLKDPALVLEAVAGQPAAIDINGLVAGTAGRSVRLTSVDSVTSTHGRALPGAQRIEYTPDITYEGPASVVFEVADEVPEGDKTAKRAYISIPVTVTPAPNRPDDAGEDIETANLPPELIGAPPVLRVGPGEGEARLDLMPLFADPDGGSFRFDDFANVSGDGRIEWRQSDDGSKLYAWTNIDTPPGTTKTISAKVYDAIEGDTPFQIRLDVIASTRPLASTTPDTAEALAGIEVITDVLSNDKSNLIDRPELTLVDAKIVGGPGRVSISGSDVKVTPAEGFVGALTVFYTVEDATKDPNRRVDEKLTVTVKDKPSRPNAPRDGTAGNGTVTFTYTPGSSNGFDISARRVTVYNAAGQVFTTAACATTTCTVNGLPNGKDYRFSVAEENQAGWSEESELSAVYTPDVTPLAPAQPRVKFGPKELTVDWDEPGWLDPSNPGSPVTSYTVVLLGEGGQVLGTQPGVGASPRSYTWKGLVNGTRYRFKVLATNAKGDSPFSEMSPVEWPAEPPGPPTNIVATATENPLGGAFQVTWAATGIEPNGDPIKQFTVIPVSQSGYVMGSAKVVPVTGAATQTVLIEGLGQVPYKFRVEAENKAGRGAGGATAEWQTAWELPKITSFDAKAGASSIAMIVTHNFEGRAAAQPVLQYSLDGGGWESWPSGGVIGGLTNGRSYSVAARLVIEGDRQSEPKTVVNVMPKSENPARLTLGNPILRDLENGNTRATMQVEMSTPSTYIESGGWDPSGYEWGCKWADSAACDEKEGGKFTWEAGAGGGGATVWYRHQDHGTTYDAGASWGEVWTGNWTATDGKPEVKNAEGVVTQPQTPATGTVYFVIRYSPGAQCTVSKASNGDPDWPGQATFNANSDGVVNISVTSDYPLPNSPTTTPQAPGNIQVNCSSGYYNAEFELG